MHHQTQIQVASRLLGHLLQQRTTRLPLKKWRTSNMHSTWLPSC